MENHKKKILILDDDEPVRESLICYFEDHGWEIVSFESGEEALEFLKDGCSSAAVVDIRLPKMDGNAFIKEAKKICPDIACAICTGFPEYHIPEEIKSLPGVSRTVFTKPLKSLAALEAELMLLMRENE
ncbi:MAG: response regulator [Planctomycetota bacterium]|jgi:DNA-binding NtrC family response regulator